MAGADSNRRFYNFLNLVAGAKWISGKRLSHQMAPSVDSPTSWSSSIPAPTSIYSDEIDTQKGRFVPRNGGTISAARCCQKSVDSRLMSVRN
jgi:hypothetical protein